MPRQYGGTYFGEYIPDTTKSYREEIKLDKQLDKVEEIIDVIQDNLDYESAHNQEILQGIRIVEEFLRKTGRVCYGGSAMNVHLPKKYKFYDPEKTIPDYDFFTPDSAADIQLLTDLLKAEGFVDIGITPGMHEGTTKVFLNYTAIADISQISSDLYDLFESRAKTIKGINYMDIDSLRMMMYLEISRPRGEVSRWKKVYERIMLLQYVAKPKKCVLKHDEKMYLDKPVHNLILNYGLNNNRVFTGIDVLNLYAKSKHRMVNGEDLHESLNPIIFYSNNITGDGDNVVKLLGNKKAKMKLLDKVGEIIPRLVIVTNEDKVVLMIVEETACHAYNTVIDDNKRNIRIASLDTIITLYFSLDLSKDSLVAEFFPSRINCMAALAVDVSNYLRSGLGGRYRAQFPFISMDCSGHQKGIASLIREKFERIKAEREREREHKSSSKTVKKSVSKTKTRKTKTRTRKSQSRSN